MRRTICAMVIALAAAIAGCGGNETGGNETKEQYKVPKEPYTTNSEGSGTYHPETGSLIVCPDGSWIYRPKTISEPTYVPVGASKLADEVTDPTDSK